jgi:hypothetical protein
MDTVRLVGDLEKVRSGETSAQDLLQQYSQFADASPMNSVLAGLRHFAADEDIRAKDQAYAEMQFRALDRLIALIRANAPTEEIEQITFLTD